MKHLILFLSFIIISCSLQAQETIRFDLNGSEKFKFESDSIGRSRILMNNNLNNIAIGTAALGSNTIGTNNIANGFNTLYSNITGNNNIANGDQALFSNTTGNDNIANGNSALASNTTGFDNIANGIHALHNNITGNNNIANGYQALFSNTTGNSNIANGSSALGFNTTGFDNIANGFQALFSNTTGENNIANGFQALYTNSTGHNNIALGNEALRNSTGSSTIGIGKNSCKNSTSLGNIGIGESALENTGFGGDNIAIGYQALQSNVIGGSNVAIGYNAGKNETGSNKLYIENTDSGPNASLIYGDFSSNDLQLNAEVGIGRPSVGFPLTIEAGSDGDIMKIYDDTEIARWHMKLTSTGDFSYTETDAADNRFRLRKGGNAGFNQSYSDVALTVKSGGGNTKLLKLESSSGTEQFHVAAGGDATLQGTLTQSSDKRLKKNIVQLTSALNGVQQLAGYRYHWIAADRSQDTQIGVIAQEVQAIYPELVRKDEKGILSVNYSGLAPILIEAVKEQQDIMDEQETRIAKLEQEKLAQEARLAQQDSRMAKMEQDKATQNNRMEKMEAALEALMTASTN